MAKCTRPNSRQRDRCHGLLNTPTAGGTRLCLFGLMPWRISESIAGGGIVGKLRVPIRRLQSPDFGTPQLLGVLSHHTDGLDCRSLEFGRVTGHNLPRSVFPHPDIRETKCSAEGGAFLVFACGGHVTCGNRKVLAIHPHVEGGIG